MKNINENQQQIGEFENSKSYVKLKFSASGKLEITIKAGDDANKELLDIQRQLAQEQLKEILKDETLKTYIAKPKPDCPF